MTTTPADLIHARQRDSRIALAIALTAALAGLYSEYFLPWRELPALCLIVVVYAFGYARWARGWVMGATYVMAKDALERVQRQIDSRTGGKS